MGLTPSYLYLGHLYYYPSSGGDISFGTAMYYGLDGRDSNSGRCKNFPSPQHPNLHGAHPASRPVGTGGPRDQRERGMALTTHLHLVPRSRIMQRYLQATCFRGVVHSLRTRVTLPFVLPVYVSQYMGIHERLMMYAVTDWTQLVNQHFCIWWLGHCFRRCQHLHSYTST
jgi:hypothetical protein